MVNTEMQNQPQKPESAGRVADDTGIIHVEAFLKIVDVESGEIVLETRA